MSAPRFRLCLLLSRNLCRLPVSTLLREAVEGGVDCVQLREKGASPAELFEFGTQVLQTCDALGVPVVVNDFVEVAAALPARGVHLGQDDMDPESARQLLGEEAWIGWSTHDLQQLEEAGSRPVDYVGFGPIFATETKGYSQGLGPTALAGALAFAPVPLVAIGGIRPETVPSLPDSLPLAVSSAICAAAHPGEVAAALLEGRWPRQGGGS